ncbi:unnamed protein product [Trichobilharzia szidati]|nr:unnamed protein product [Trichobilharzia szidati]
MSQFQPISLGQTVQIPSQQQQQQQQQQILQQQNQCQQYQLEPCDIKPQFSLIPNVSQNLTNNNNNNNNMNISQSGIGNFGALMTTLDTVVSGMNNNNNTGGGQAGQFATPMNHTDVASLLMNPSKRAETFVIDEVKVMLKEIEARKHILLSLSPSTNRLKRRAWEDVAMSMAARWPHAPRRTADQVKKKWENLVSKTKRKVRAGHITPELDWNETNAAVMQFLTQHSPPVRLRYLSSIGPSLLSLGDLQASSASASGSALTTSGSATTAMNGGGGGINAFNQTNSHIYGLSNTSFTDPYSNSNHNNNSSIFSNNQHSSLMLSSEKSAILDSCLRQESINNSNNNNNNSSSSNSNNNTTTNTTNACSSHSNNNNSINGQHSFINHETNDLNSFNNAGSGGGGPGAGGGDKQQHLNTSTEDKDVDMTTGNNNNSSNNKSQNHGDSSEVVGNITGSVNESFLSSFTPFNQSFLNFGLPASNHHDSLYTTFNQDIQKELYSQLKQEHELRMDILRLQKQAWLLQMNLFKKMKVEQISSLFSSPQLSLPTTTTTPTPTTPSNATTTNSVVSSTNSTGCSNTSVSISLSSSLTVPSSNEVNHSAMNNSTSVPSINPSATPVTASLTSTLTTATSATTTSITKPNSSIQQSNVNHQSESNSTPETRSLSPMFPGDANSHPPPQHHHQNVVLTNVEKIEG